MDKKCSTSQGYIRKEVTSYKIGTLDQYSNIHIFTKVASSKFCLFFLFSFIPIQIPCLLFITHFAPFKTEIFFSLVSSNVGSLLRSFNQTNSPIFFAFILYFNSNNFYSFLLTFCLSIFHSIKLVSQFYLSNPFPQDP